MILLFLFLSNFVFTITQGELMRVIFENGEYGQTQAEVNRDLESKLPPIGYVAGEPIRSRFWDRMNPNERVFFDQDGIPFQLPWRSNNKPITLGEMYKTKAVMRSQRN